MFIINILRIVYNYCFGGKGGGITDVSPSFLSPDSGRTSRRVPTCFPRLYGEVSIQLKNDVFQLDEDVSGIFPTYCWYLVMLAEEVEGKRQAWRQIKLNVDKNYEEWDWQEAEYEWEMAKTETDPNSVFRVGQHRFGRPPVPGQRVRFANCSKNCYVNVVTEELLEEEDYYFVEDLIEENEDSDGEDAFDEDDHVVEDEDEDNDSVHQDGEEDDSVLDLFEEEDREAPVLVPHQPEVEGSVLQEAFTLEEDSVPEVASSGDSVQELFEEQDEEDSVEEGGDGGGNQVVVRRQPLRRSARIAARAPPRRSRRLAAMPRVSYKGMC